MTCTLIDPDIAAAHRTMGHQIWAIYLKQSFGRIQYLHTLVDEKSSESTNKHVNLKDKNVFP